MISLKLGLTPEQIAGRRKFIGGSDAAKIVSGDWHSLWLEKTGRVICDTIWYDGKVQMAAPRLLLKKMLAVAESLVPSLTFTVMTRVVVSGVALVFENVTAFRAVS